MVAALLDGIAAMRQSLRDDNASALHIDGALALQQCAQIIERTTLLAGELTAREPRSQAQDDDPSAPRKRPRHHRQNQGQSQSQTTITAVAAQAPTAPAPTMFRLRLGLGDLEQTLLVRTADFLDDQGLEAIDAVSQLFHPLGVVQKLCMVRAGRWLKAGRWMWVERPVMPWPQWLAGQAGGAGLGQCGAQPGTGGRRRGPRPSTAQYLHANDPGLCRASAGTAAAGRGWSPREGSSQHRRPAPLRGRPGTV